MERLYDELAAWWPWLSAPEEYAGEAAFLAEALEAPDAGTRPTLLELGSGGGSVAVHLARRFEVTLVDRAMGMLDVSRRLNPHGEHRLGDMRSVRLARTFDRVLIHDAIGYLTTPDDLDAALETAFVHLRPGGVALFAPDHVRETFRPTTTCGGRDAGGRGLRWLEWRWDPDPADDTYVVDFAFLLREADGAIRSVADRHVLGLFPRALWLERLAAAGFDAEELTYPAGLVEPGEGILFRGRRR